MAERMSLATIEKAAGIGSAFLGLAKKFGESGLATAVKADAKALPGQIRGLTQAGANENFLRRTVGPKWMAPTGSTPGTSGIFNQPKTQMKDLIRNKALVTGAAGVAGAAALMTPRRNQSDNDNQKFACVRRLVEENGIDFVTAVELTKQASYDLEKQAWSDENKQVAKTFAVQTAAAIPAHIIGGAVGGSVGNKYLNGTAEKISNGMNRVTSRLSDTGPIGARIAKHLHVGKMSGSSLGVGLGIAAAGGIADIAALRGTLKSKNTNNEQ